MQLRTQIGLIIALAVGVWCVSLWVYDIPVDASMLKPFGTTVTVVTAIAVMFEKFAWKWPLINGLLVSRPPIQGTWRTELVSSYQEDGNNITKTVFVVIQQSLTTFSLRMYTDKANSFSIAESIRKSGVDDLFEVAIVYQNVPDLTHRQTREDSQIHFGALHLTDIPPRPTTMKGPYWTDRNTNGTLKLIQRKRKRVSSYEEGEALFR